MVVTSNSKNATMLRCTKGISMTNHIHAAINTWTFAIPHAEYAVVFGTLKQIDLLTAPDCCRCQIFVNSGLKMNVVLNKKLFSPPHGLVNGAKR